MERETPCVTPVLEEVSLNPLPLTLVTSVALELSLSILVPQVAMIVLPVSTPTSSVPTPATTVKREVSLTARVLPNVPIVLLDHTPSRMVPILAPSAEPDGPKD